ncbi:MAG: transposase [Burkholderia sp.]
MSRKTGAAAARVSVPPPGLYLRGISTGDMSEALGIMLGGEVAGMSPNSVSRLKAQWADQHAQWNRRDLSSVRWVYWWADGIHTGVRSDDSDGQRLLAIIGVTLEGEKGRVAIGDGYWESKESWCERLLHLKKRGLPAGPLLACGDGAMGFGSAMEEGFPQTKHQRCWFHKMSKRAQRAAEVQAGTREAGAASHLDGGPATRADALVGFNDFVDNYSAKYPKTAEKLTEDSDERLAFYDFPAEHWQHLRTTNPIE